MTFMTELMKVMASYMAVILIAFVGIGFWFRGLYLSFIRVKMSAGRKLLVNIRMPTHNYFRIGEIIEGNFLRFKDYGSKMKLINLENEAGDNPIYRMGTVSAVNVDGVKGLIMTPELKGMNTYDPEKIDSLYTRCLYKPPVFDNTQKILLILLILILVGLIGIGALQYQTYKAVHALNTL